MKRNRWTALRGPEDETSAGGGGIDMEAAVEDIGSGLGLDQVDEIDNMEELDERKPVPAPKAEKGEEEEALDTPKEGEEASSEISEEKPAEPVKTAPKTWRPEAAKEWDKLPPTVKDEILKREQDMFDGISQYKEAAEFGRGFYKTLEPFIPILKEYKINPHQQVANLMNSHYTLAFGRPEEKQALIRKVMQDYNIQLEGDAGTESSYTDPEVVDLRSQISRLQSELNSLVGSRKQELAQTLESQIQAFSADPANEFFNEVMVDMTELLNKGVVTNIKDAYQRAIYLNPDVRQKVIAKEFAAKEAERQKAEEEKRNKAKEAAKANKVSRVVSRQVPGSGTAPLGTIDDTLREAYRSITNQSE